LESASLSDRESLRQQQRQQALRQRQEAVAEGRPAVPSVSKDDRLPEQESPCFPIQRILLKGDAAEPFQPLVAAADRPDDPAIGRCLGSEGINQVIQRIQNALMAQGYITAQVRIEPQDLNSGVLTLTLVPGRIRTIRFTEGSGPSATYRNALPARPGDLLNLRAIEQGLENFKRVPTAEADIQIAPAEGKDARPGESDLVIAWQQSLPFRASLSLDDSGSKETGKRQLGLTLSYDNPLGLNDLLYVNFNGDQDDRDGVRGTEGGSLHYSIPYGDWLLSYTGSDYQYHQSVAGSTQTYRYSGTSFKNEVEVSRMLYRDAVRKTKLNLGVWQRGSNNYIDDTEVEVQRRRVAGLELGVDHSLYLGSATLQSVIAYRYGMDILGSMDAPEEGTGEGTARPRFVTLEVDYKQPFQMGGVSLQYSAELSGQWNDTPLVPQDRFAIGGRYTVRGFDGESQLSGDQGWLVRNELGMALGGSGQQLYLGIDFGGVGGQSSQNLVGTELSGGVVGLRGSFKNLRYDLFLGGPIDKPEGFESDPLVSGFSLYWNL
jgi:hemolysin activation/secretion protein